MTHIKKPKRARIVVPDPDWLATMRALPGLFVPLVTVSEMNQREHWSARAGRVKAQRQTIALALLAWDQFNDLQSRFQRYVNHAEPVRLQVTLTRYAPGLLDPGDGLNSAFKGCRDEIARFVGLDDRSDKYAWIYRQEKCKRGRYGVRIEMEIISSGT